MFHLIFKQSVCGGLGGGDQHDSTSWSLKAVLILVTNHQVNLQINFLCFNLHHS